MGKFLELENKHKGQDIYVVASGKSCDWIDPDYFVGRIAIGVNQVYRRFNGLRYIVRKDGGLEEGVDIPCIMPELRYGNRGNEPNQADYLFKHHNNKHAIVDFDVHPHNENIIVSHSTITSAIHVAAFMGARSILIVGHDGKPINGESNFRGYHGDPPPLWANYTDYNNWLSTILPTTKAVQEYIEREYGCQVLYCTPLVS